MYIKFKVKDSEAGLSVEAVYPFIGIEFLADCEVAQLTVSGINHSMVLYASATLMEYSKFVMDITTAIKEGEKIFACNSVFSKAPEDTEKTCL